jgi:hypothetical protein
VPWTIANIHTGRIPTLLLAGAEANNFLSMVPACLLSQYQVRYITGGDIYDYYDSASASINASASFYGSGDKEVSALIPMLHLP